MGTVTIERAASGSRPRATEHELTGTDACFIIEGVIPATTEEVVEAWAHLIRTGACWNLQGWYGRTAQAMINAGIISKNGRVLHNEMNPVIACDHLDYDDYFEKCFDCGATVEEIHASECAGFDVDDEGRCEHCGYQVEEEAA